MNIIQISIIALGILGILFTKSIVSYIGDHCTKPMLRENEGHIEFKYWKHKRWYPVTWWNNSDGPRKATIYDSVHNRQWTATYDGPGRVYYTNEKDIPKLNAYSLYRLECHNIEKEDKILKKVIEKYFENEQ